VVGLRFRAFRGGGVGIWSGEWAMAVVVVMVFVIGVGEGEIVVGVEVATRFLLRVGGVGS